MVVTDVASFVENIFCDNLLLIQIWYIFRVSVPNQENTNNIEILNAHIRMANIEDSSDGDKTATSTSYKWSRSSTETTHQNSIHLMLTSYFHPADKK